MTTEEVQKILLIDQSPNSRLHLSQILAADPKMRIMGISIDEESTLTTIESFKPDIILLDATTSEIISRHLIERLIHILHAPIIILATNDNIPKANTCFRTLSTEIITVVPKPEKTNDLYYDRDCLFLLDTLRNITNGAIKISEPLSYSTKPPPQNPADLQNYQAIGIGGSLGAPTVLHTILSQLLSTIPAPIFIVQHILPGFLDGMIDWLDHTSRLRIKIAEDGEIGEPGTAYIAPDYCFMEIFKGNEIRLDKKRVKEGFQPSIAKLYSSLTHTHGPNCIGVMITGMGKDGVLKLLEMKKMGALTIVQDPNDCLATEMVLKAIKLKAACRILSPERIVYTLNALCVANPLPPGEA